ncbi:MAG TPA: dipeptidase [Gemmatirosa sp.]|nr:dipeptidase [Gemmatirosa sp.]
MRTSPFLLATAAVTLAGPLAAQRPQAPRLSTAAATARVEAALRAQPVVDGHNDLPWAIREATRDAGRADLPDVEAYDLRRRVPGQTDLARLKQGRVGVQFWSVYIPGEPDAEVYQRQGTVTGTPGYARVQLEAIDVARRAIARYPDALALVTRHAEVAPAVRAGRVAGFLGMEGGHAIENSLGALRAYYDLGVRYMTLTHNVTLDWADAAQDTARHGGLSKFGEEVVREMNRLGMLVDLSHVSEATMQDALRVSEAPVIWSHSSAKAVNDHPRNVPDDVLRLLPRNGGVVMVTFVSSFVSPRVRAYQATRDDSAVAFRARYPGNEEAARAAMRQWRAANPAPRATIADVADHIEHVRRVAGVDHVGLGGDFDGTTDLPQGLEDVSGYPALLVELARRGWTEAELRKVAGENALRALRRAEEVAARLQRERAPSTRTLRQLDATP